MDIVSQTSSYSKYLFLSVFADHLLSNMNTTLTGGLEIPINSKYETGYTYQVVDASGNKDRTFIGKTKVFIVTDNSFNNEYLYNISAYKSKIICIKFR